MGMNQRSLYLCSDGCMAIEQGQLSSWHIHSTSKLLTYVLRKRQSGMMLVVIKMHKTMTEACRSSYYIETGDKDSDKTSS